MRVLAPFLVTALVFALADVVTAADVEPAVFKVSEDTGFAKYRSALVAYLRSLHIIRGTRVCILGERFSNGAKSAWVIWPAGHRMILWDGGDSPMKASRRILDLKKDVVASEAEVAGSTYLVTREWVSEEQQRCERFGISLEVTAAELREKESP
jgi:hypothetical protein